MSFPQYGLILKGYQNLWAIANRSSVQNNVVSIKIIPSAAKSFATSGHLSHLIV
jgi:hypothetical protein